MRLQNQMQDNSVIEMSNLQNTDLKQIQEVNKEENAMLDRLYQRLNEVKMKISQQNFDPSSLIAYQQEVVYDPETNLNDSQIKKEIDELQYQIQLIDLELHNETFNEPAICFPDDYESQIESLHVKEFYK